MVGSLYSSPTIREGWGKGFVSGFVRAGLFLGCWKNVWKDVLRVKKAVRARASERRVAIGGGNANTARPCPFPLAITLPGSRPTPHPRPPSHSLPRRHRR